MKKIMFNDKYGLTKAVLEGRKTQTRRIVPESALIDWGIHDKYHNLSDAVGHRMDFEYFLLTYARYEVGEKVAVAQSYNTVIQETFDKGGEFKGSCSIFKSKGLDNKMFVRSELMPHCIKIINIRVERLQDISDEDCLKEGVVQCETPTCHKHFCTRDCGDCAPSPREAFAILLDKVSGKGKWDSNPWVFVYDFELVKH